MDRLSLDGIGEIDVVIDGNKSPLQVGLQRTTASLAKCFQGIQRKISYPLFHYHA